MINDVAPDDFSSFPDATGSSSGNAFDIWDDDSHENVVLPPMDMDVMDDTPREVGFPDECSEYWHYQGYSSDCALYAQGGILEAEGQPLDIQKYEQQGMDGGWYTPDEGTYIDGFGKLLNENGVPSTVYEGASIQDMADQLDGGHGVVVAVDTLPIWDQPGGHALWVTGMDVGPDGVPASVICNDSGREDGQAYHYPFEAFQEAWNNYGNIMISTDRPLSVLS